MSVIVPVILCGGSGTRLWPESRKALPKQFLPLLGRQSLFQATLQRAQALSPEGDVVILANEETRFQVLADVESADVKADIVLEPQARDTAAAVAIAALMTARREAQAVAVIMPSDHYIAPQDVFMEDIARAVEAARHGSITVFGIVPTAPSTAYGYIAPGDPLEEVTDLRRVASFHEKPDLSSAAEFIAAGRLWNSGLFVARADVLLDAFQLHAPKILDAARAALDLAQADKAFLRLEAKAFGAAEKLPFDIAVMEKTLNAAVLPARFAWSDIGAWDALWAVAGKDVSGNCISGDVVLEDTQNSLIRASGQLTAVLGLDNIAVVATPDAVLVAPLSRMQNVKQLVARLESEGRKEVAAHRAAYRPWGQYETKDRGERYQVKRITVKPGGRLSLQKHFHRSEHWVVVRGTACVTIDGKTAEISENESTYIPIGAVHRLENPGKIPLELVEVQVGTYLEEDDIVRLEDVYGRELGQEPARRATKT